MSKKFDYPRGCRSSLNLRLAESCKGAEITVASKRFLDAMLPVIQNAKEHNDKGRYITPAALEDLLAESDKKFNELLSFLKQLPAHVKQELGTGLVMGLQKNLKSLLETERVRHPKLPGGSNFFRSILLNDMVKEYRKAFGEYPLHTYPRGNPPAKYKIKGFHGVAYMICELAGFSPAGIENELREIKNVKIKPPRPIEEVRAEIQANKGAKPTD